MRNRWESEEEISEPNGNSITQGLGMLITFVLNVTVLIALFFVNALLHPVEGMIESSRKQEGESAKDQIELNQLSHN
jgi:hypothetical protein